MDALALYYAAAAVVAYNLPDILVCKGCVGAARARELKPYLHGLAALAAYRAVQFLPPRKPGVAIGPGDLASEADYWLKVFVGFVVVFVLRAWRKFARGQMVPVVGLAPAAAPARGPGRRGRGGRRA